MERIQSFQVDHTRLNKGLYLSRVDQSGGHPVSTFDLRMKKPNAEPVMETAPIHTIEHIGATFLRNHKRKDEVIYFGPMGCRTGFYLVLAGRLSSREILPWMREAFEFIARFEGSIPGATAMECGNYLDQNLSAAKAEALRYAEILANATEENLVYPH